MLLSLLSWQGKAQADARTYEQVNKWSGDATEGDPITVKHLQGWNQDQVTVGKDSTRQVTIEDYGGGNGGYATVLGKNISFTGGFTTGGTIHAGSADTENLSAVTVNAVQLGGQSAGGTVDLDGKNLSVTGSQGVNAAGGSTLSLGTRYMTGNLYIQTLSVSGSSTVTIGNANAGDITIDKFGVGGTQTPSMGEPILNTITVSGNNLSIGNTRASESNAQVTFNARGNVTAKNGLVMTGSYLPSSAPYASITVNAGGDVELGTYGQTSSSWNRNAALAAVGGSCQDCCDGRWESGCFRRFHRDWGRQHPGKSRRHLVGRSPSCHRERCQLDPHRRRSGGEPGGYHCSGTPGGQPGDRFPYGEDHHPGSGGGWQLLPSVPPCDGL